MRNKILRSTLSRLTAVLLTGMLALSVTPVTSIAEETIEEGTEDDGMWSESSDEGEGNGETASDGPGAGSGTESAAETPTPIPTPPPAEIMPTNGIDGWPKSLDTNGDYIYLVDADTGAILLEKGQDTETPPASLTKIMTCLLAIENGGDLGAQVTMDETGVEYAVTGSSSLYTQVGEVFTLRDMLYGIMLKSANDMATQVGKFIGGGDLDAFVQMMNDRASEIGCTGTHFVNACGMPAEGHVSTAHDMALIFQEALRNELFREIIHTRVYTIPATNMTADERIIENHHPFISNDEWNTYEGILGGKTGYTDLAGSCLITGCERNGMTLIAVTMHCDSSLGFEEDTVQLLDFGYDNFFHADVGSGDEGLLSGGYVTLPNGASPADCTYEDEEVTAEDGSVRTVRTWSWNGWVVGTSVYEGASAESGSTVPAEQEGTGTDISSVAAFGEGESAPAESVTTSPASEGSDISFMGISMTRNTFFALCMLTLAILIGLIVIIISMLLRNEKKRRRRRRR